MYLDLHDRFSADTLRETFEAKGQKSDVPFASICIDKFLDSDAILSEINSEFGFDGQHYETENQSRMLKNSTWNIDQLGPISQALCMYLNSSNFITQIEKTFGIEHLIPDPHLFGGGYHETLPGGYLKIHADNNWDTRLLLNRRINLIYYVNETWNSDWGGSLELWNADMTKAERIIEPVGDRLCLFINNDLAHHGHPEPLQAPDGVTRRSIAMYYYSTEPAPENKKSFLPHSTIYKTRPNESFVKRRFGMQLIRRLVPPIFLDLWSYWKRR